MIYAEGSWVCRALVFCGILTNILRNCKVTAASTASFPSIFNFVAPFSGSRKKRRRNLKYTYPLRQLSSMSDDKDEKQSPTIVSKLPGEEVPDEIVIPQSFKDKLKTRLILHLDINETVILGDVSGGDSRLDSMHKMFAKSAFCQIPNDNDSSNTNISYEDTKLLKPTHWWDGQVIGSETATPPPLYTGWNWPKNCCPYYRTSYKSKSSNFVEHHGKVYQELFDRTQRALEQSETNKSATSEMSTDSHILPALYHTLDHLIANEDEQPCTVVFRTFGSDLPDIANALADFAQGKHPDYSHINHPNFCIPRDRLYQGRWKMSEDRSKVGGDGLHGMVYQLWDLDETHVVASGDSAILELLDGLPMCGIRDDYPHWAGNKWLPTAGKPVWVPHFAFDDEIERDKQVSASGIGQYDHHILFDDNIHNLHKDGIACIRQEQADGSFDTLDCERMHQLQGIHLVRVPTVEPVLNPKWFVEQIEQARSRVYQRLWTAKEGRVDTKTRSS